MEHYPWKQKIETIERILASVLAAIGGFTALVCIWRRLRIALAQKGSDEEERLLGIIKKYKQLLGEEKRNEAKLEQEVERLRQLIERATDIYGRAMEAEAAADELKKQPQQQQQQQQQQQGDLEGGQHYESDDAVQSSTQMESPPHNSSAEASPHSREKKSSYHRLEDTDEEEESESLTGGSGGGLTRMSSLANLTDADTPTLPDIWIGYMDEKTDCMYYYNPGRGQTSWVEPDRKNNSILIHVDAVTMIRQASTEEAAERSREQLDELQKQGMQLLSAERERVSRLEQELSRVRMESLELQRLVVVQKRHEKALEKELNQAQSNQCSMGGKSSRSSKTSRSGSGSHFGAWDSEAKKERAAKDELDLEDIQLLVHSAFFQSEVREKTLKVLTDLWIEYSTPQGMIYWYNPGLDRRTLLRPQSGNVLNHLQAAQALEKGKGDRDKRLLNSLQLWETQSKQATLMP